MKSTQDKPALVLRKTGLRVLNEVEVYAVGGAVLQINTGAGPYWLEGDSDPSNVSATSGNCSTARNGPIY